MTKCEHAIDIRVGDDLASKLVAGGIELILEDCSRLWFNHEPPQYLTAHQIRRIRRFIQKTDGDIDYINRVTIK